MKLHISYAGLSKPEHIRVLQAAFQEGALGEAVFKNKEVRLSVELPREAQIIRTLSAEGKAAGFALKVSRTDKDSISYSAYTL